MRPKTTLAALETGRDDRMAEAARDLGHELPRQRIEVLNEFRRGLAELARKTAGDSYARGFCDALEQVSAAYIAETAQLEDFARASRVIEAKPRWAKVLRALAEGHGLPRGISEASGLPASSVTRTLQELEDASLIERPPPSPEADGRQRPCVLTALGAELTRRLFKDADPRIAAVRDMLPMISRFFSSLISQGRVTSIELLQLAAPSVGWGPAECVVEDLLGAAEKAALALRDPDGAIAVEVPDLSKVLTETRGAPDRFRSMKQVLLQNIQTYVFSSRWEYLWDQWARIGRLDNVVTLNSADLRYRLPLSAPYQVLYDDPVLVQRDIEQEQTRAMLQAASQRLCLVSSTRRPILPPSITPVLVEA